MIPKYPFRVTYTRRVGSALSPSGRTQVTKSFETLPAAFEYASVVAKQPLTTTVEVSVVLVESSRPPTKH